MALPVGDLYATLELKDELDKGLQSAFSALGDAERGFVNMGATASAAMSLAGQNLTENLTRPILEMGKTAVETFANFERSMNFVQAVTGATGADFEMLKSQAQELGRTTQFTAQQAADGMKFLAMAGFETNEIYAAMPGVLQLAASAQMEVGRAADIVTNVLTGYNKSVEELSHVNDVMVATFTSTNTSLEQLGQALKYVGPIASSAGLAFEEMNAAIGLLGNAGIQASMAGTSLRGAITHLLEPTKKAAAVLDDWGIKVTDAQGKMLSFAEIIRQFEPHAEETGKLMTIFGQRAGPAMAALITQGSDALKKLTDEVTNAGGVAERVANTQMQGLMGAWIQFKSATEGLAITLGERLKPAMMAILETLTEAVRWFQTLPVGVQEAVIAIAAFAAAIGPVLIALGSLQMVLGLVGAALGTAVLPLIGQAVLAFGTLVIVKEATDWFLDLHPAIRATADFFAQAAIEATGLGAALRMYNAHLEKGVDVTKSFTPEQQKALEVLKASQQIELDTAAAFDAVAGSGEKVVEVTNNMARAIETWSTKDIKAKFAAKEEADKLAKATSLIGEKVEDLPTAQKIIDMAAAHDKAEAAAKAHAKAIDAIAMAMLKAEQESQKMGLATGFTLGELPSAVPKVADMGWGASGIDAMKIASDALAKGMKPELIKEKLIKGLNLTQAEAEGVLKALGQGVETVTKSAFSTAFDNLPKTILAAITGGGDVGKAVGASLLGGVGEDLGKKIASSLGGKLGSTIGGFMGPLGSMAGSLIGGLVSKGLGKLAGALGIGGNKTIMQVNDMRDAFFEAQGGFEKFSQKMAAVSKEDWAKKIFDAKTVEDFNRLVTEAQSLLDTQSQAQEALNDAIDRYGFTLEELPAKMKQDELDAGFAQLFQDFQLLSAAGFDTNVVLERMGPSINEMVNQAIAAGGTIPEAMRPIIEQMIAQGQLLDENGEAYTSVEDAGINFAQTMTEQFQTLIEKIDQMVSALLGIPSNVSTNVNVNTNYTSSGGGGGRPSDEDFPPGVPRFAEGAFVTAPTLAVVGDAPGGEAIIPASDMAGMMGAGQPQQPTELSAGALRTIVKGVRDALLQAGG